MFVMGCVTGKHHIKYSKKEALSTKKLIVDGLNLFLTQKK